MINKKIFRYYYWLLTEFFKKHLKIIIISFFISFISIISIISLFPYFNSQIIFQKEIIGIIGKYDLNNIPTEIEEKISNGLIYIDQRGKIIPILASSWKIIDNGKTYRFYLKDNLFWNDGKKFTAFDINYQFKDVNYKAIDEKTIEFYLKKPLPIFPIYLKKPIIRYPLLGVAGLYKTVKIKQKYGNLIEVTLSSNKKDLPAVVYKFYNNEAQLITAYKKGEINQMTITKKTSAEYFNSWKNTTVKKSVDYSKLITLFFNNEKAILKEKEIRETIAMIIPAEFYFELGEMAIGPIPPTSWAYNDKLKKPTYNPEAARKIIEKNISATQSAKLKLITYYDYYLPASEIKAFLEKIGLTIDLKITSDERPNDFDFLLVGLNLASDPDQYYFWHSTQIAGNISNYKNVKIDKLLEDGRNTLNLDERKKIYSEFQKVIIDDPPGLFLYYPFVYTIKRK